MEIPKELLALLDACRPSRPPGYEDWEYRDLRWMLPKFWEEILAILGEGNYRVLAKSSRTIEGQTAVRGQVWISPAGMANLVKHNARLTPTNQEPTDER